MVGSNRSDVDLFIFDPSGRQIASDEGFLRGHGVYYGPAATYRIEVRNLGNSPNDVSVTANYVAR